MNCQLSTVNWFWLILHRRAQLSTTKLSETTCKGEIEALSLRQIEPGSLKNFSAQLKEGAKASRPMRPRFFAPAGPPHCHSERSSPIFCCHFAPAKGSGCVVEESFFAFLSYAPSDVGAGARMAAGAISSLIGPLRICIIISVAQCAPTWSGLFLLWGLCRGAL